MGRSIIREVVDGRELFIVWSSIVDAPVTFAMTKDELYEFVEQEAAEQARASLDHKFNRQTPRFGTIDDELCVNRAGADETRLTREQILDYYFVRRGDGEQPVGVAYGDDEALEHCSQCGAQVLGYHACEVYE